MRTHTKNFTTVTATVALAVGATFSLSGCFGNPLEKLAQGGANEIVENVTGGDVDMSGQSMPKDFPSQISVPDGKIIFGTSTNVDDTRGWMLNMVVKDPSVFAAVQNQLKSSGFDEIAATDGATAMGIYQGNGYGIVLNLAEDDGEYTISYIVTESDD